MLLEDVTRASSVANQRARGLDMMADDKSEAKEKMRM